VLPFVREHSAAVLADLRREYGIDLLDFWRGQLSFFEICAYLGELSAETRTGRLMRNMPDEVEGWGLVPQLLGALVDAVRGQWSEKPVESILPSGLFDKSHQPKRKSNLKLQPDSAAFALLGSPAAFVSRHTGR